MITVAEIMSQKSSGPTIKRFRSKQDIATPWEFISAVERRFGHITFDLAASAHNAKANKYFTESQDSLKQDWKELKGTLWLNPPFGNIKPWVKKADESSHVSPHNRILVLVPASVGSLWWAEHVHLKCQVHFLRPRISFDGKHPFPKDLALLVYDHHLTSSYNCWDWKNNAV